MTKEDPGGEAPSAATPAQAAQELRSAWESEVARAQELADALDRERARAKKLAPLHKSMAARNQTQVKLFAAYPSRVTNDHYVQLGGELRRERELALALDRPEYGFRSWRWHRRSRRPGLRHWSERWRGRWRRRERWHGSRRRRGRPG